MLINLSNHPSTKWDEKQKQAALDQFGSFEHRKSRDFEKAIIDIPFPNIPPEASSEQVLEMAKEMARKIVGIWFNMIDENEEVTLHLMGEVTFVTHLRNRLRSDVGTSIRVVCSTTERKVIEIDGKKIAEFDFIQFREY